jgi:hypothetical protein
MGPCKGLASQLPHRLWAHSMSSAVAEHGPMQRSRSADLWAYSMPSVVMGHGPMQRSRYIQCHGSGPAWAHTKVSVGSSPTSYGPISMPSVVAEHGPMQRSRSAALWAYSMPSVVMWHGPMQRSRLAAHPPAMGPFSVISSGRAWAHAKVSLASCPTSYGPIQCHR